MELEDQELWGPPIVDVKLEKTHKRKRKESDKSLDTPKEEKKKDNATQSRFRLARKIFKDRKQQQKILVNKIEATLVLKEKKIDVCDQISSVISEKKNDVIHWHKKLKRCGKAIIPQSMKKKLNDDDIIKKFDDRVQVLTKVVNFFLKELDTYKKESIKESKEIQLIKTSLDEFVDQVSVDQQKISEQFTYHPSTTEEYNPFQKPKSCLITNIFSIFNSTAETKLNQIYIKKKNKT